MKLFECETYNEILDNQHFKKITQTNWVYMYVCAAKGVSKCIGKITKKFLE